MHPFHEKTGDRLHDRPPASVEPQDYPVFLSLTSVNSASTTLPSSFLPASPSGADCCDCCCSPCFACSWAYIFSPSFCAACASTCCFASISDLSSDLSAPSASFTAASIFSLSHAPSLSPQSLQHF